MDKIYGFKDNFGKVEVPSLSAVQQNIGIKLFCDNNVFRVDDKGTPMPSEQVAHIRLLKGLITDPVVWTKDGKTVEATDSLDVSVSDMAYPQAVLKNINTNDTANLETMSGTIESWGGVQLKQYTERIPIKSLEGKKVYIGFDCRFLSSKTEITRVCLNFGGNNEVVALYNNGSSGVVRGSNIISPLGSIAYEVLLVFGYGPAGTAISAEVGRVMIFDITELSLAYPQYSDEQLKTMLDEHLGYIPAQQSVSIGGLMRLENLVPNPTFKNNGEGGWYERNSEISYVGESATITPSAQYGSLVNYCKIKSDERYFWTVDTETDDPNWIMVVNNSRDQIFSILQYVRHKVAMFNIQNTADGYVGFQYNGTSSFPPITIHHPVLLEMKSSGLDLWLELNGYNNDGKKADWCNAHIPFFEGETNICVSVRNSLPVKVTAGAYEDTLTLQAVESLSTSLADSEIVMSGDGFIRYKDGTQICWGLVRFDGTTETHEEKTYTLPLPFSDDSYALILTPYGYSSSNLYTEYSTSSATTFVIEKNGSKTSRYYYLAIGRWK